MECTPCNTSPIRPDRPHTFFAHEPTTCPGCAAAVEARVVLRDEAVFHLMHCTACGQTERKVADDAATYVAAFVERGMPTPVEHVFKYTTSTCPSCLALLLTKVVVRDGRVYFQKDCGRCGPSEALVSEDAAYYARAYAFARAGTQPLHYGNKVEHGCPTDCGTCDDHEQHTCLPIIEITDHCNLECPICIVDNQYSKHMSMADFSGLLDVLIKAEGQCESVALSGGEPTSHPEILELLRHAVARPEIGRVVLITNGVRLGRDRGFAQQIKDSGCYVALQLDGFDDEVHRTIRGRDLQVEKDAALAVLKDLLIPTQLIFVATMGVNDHQIGRAVELLLREDHILSLNFQPAAYTGQGGGTFAHDPMDRLTIPGVIQRAEAQSGGTVKASDFFPLPCSHPQCVSLTYLLRLGPGDAVPFARFVDFEKYSTLLRSSATLPASPEVEDALAEVIHDVFARQDEIPRGDEILRALRRSVDEMFPARPVSQREAQRLSEGQSKSIFLHHYMDRHDFDLERLRKCCHHYPQLDGKIMPACGFNMFHRGAAKGAATPTPAWGKSPQVRLPVIP